MTEKEKKTYKGCLPPLPSASLKLIWLTPLTGRHIHTESDYKNIIDCEMSSMFGMMNEIFSFFCLFSYVSTYQLPFYDDQERNMFENIVYTTPDIPDWLGAEARDCLLKVSKRNPKLCD